MSLHVPYTYLIGWSKLDRWYYGSRYAKDCQPADLWNPYRTSSKYVLKLIEEFGEPDVIEVRETFSDVKSCREWEHRVLRRLKVHTSEKWLNKTHNKSIPPEICSLGGKTLIGKAKSEKHRENLRSSLLGRKFQHMFVPASEAKKEKIRSSLKGRKLPEEHKQAISLGLKGKHPWVGKSHTEETKQKLREKNRGKTAFLGRKHSEASKLKMSETRKRMFQEGPLS